MVKFVDVILWGLELRVNLFDVLLVVIMSSELVQLLHLFTYLNYTAPQLRSQELEVYFSLAFWQVSWLCCHTFEMAPKDHDAEEFKQDEAYYC